jgi:hypothetical protein
MPGSKVRRLRFLDNPVLRMYFDILGRPYGRLFLVFFRGVYISIGRCEAGTRTILNVCRAENVRDAPNLPRELFGQWICCAGILEDPGKLCYNTNIRRLALVRRIRRLNDAFGADPARPAAQAGLRGAIGCSNS